MSEDKVPLTLRAAQALQVASGCGCMVVLVATVGAYFLWASHFWYSLGLIVFGLVTLVIFVKLAELAEAARKFHEANEEMVPLIKAGGAALASAYDAVTSRTIRTKVAGVMFANPDGTDRQEIIRRFCKPDGELMLKPEPDNERDEFAISVWVRTSPGPKPRWKQIGYIKSDRTEDVHALYDDGLAVSARILQVTEGGPDRRCGVNIEIFTS